MARLGPNETVTGPLLPCSPPEHHRGLGVRLAEVAADVERCRQATGPRTLSERVTRVTEGGGRRCAALPRGLRDAVSLAGWAAYSPSSASIFLTPSLASSA